MRSRRVAHENQNAIPTELRVRTPKYRRDAWLWCMMVTTKMAKGSDMLRAMRFAMERLAEQPPESLPRQSQPRPSARPCRAFAAPEAPTTSDDENS
jgi:hypothetical protein